MKMQICGFEITEGVSKKTGKPYSIGKLHTLIPLAGSEGARGYCGHSYACEVSILRKVENIQPPFVADVEVGQVMRFGQAQNEVVSVVPASGKPVAAAV
jgi:hypothetical protein